MPPNSDDDDLLFADEDESSTPTVERKSWKVMIVDDEQSVHDVTRFALADICFAGRTLQFIDAYSGEEAKQLLRENPDTALMLLDVVMESDDAGLHVARHARDTLGNTLVRIVLRTGQPGQAPEQEVILNYDINDYKEKTELTTKKLFTTVISALRSYRDLQVIERNREGLERIIDASPNIFRLQSMQNFASGVMMQVVALLGLNQDSFLSGLDQHCHAGSFFSDESGDRSRIMAASGAYQDMLHQPIEEVVSPLIREKMAEALHKRTNIYFDDQCVMYIHTPNKHGNLVYFSGCGSLDDTDQQLLDVFCANVSIAFQNIELNQELEITQKEIINTLGTVAEFRSSEVGQHIERVAEYSYLLALKYGLPRAEADRIRLASPMHDIGKLGIPDSILNKPEKLTEEEYEVMKTHTTLGYEMLKTSKRPILKAAAIIAKQHQEKWDGSGYPEGLQGEDIHIYGRITALADVYDALGSKRVYKGPWPLGHILDYFKENKGSHFDPTLVDLFIDNIEEFLEIQSHYSKT